MKKRAFIAEQPGPGRVRKRRARRDIVIVAVSFVVAVISVGFASYYQATGKATTKTYYATLANQCFDSEDSSCCIASVQRMQMYGYLQAVGGSCREGFEKDSLRCSSSFTWCVPGETPVKGKYHAGDEVKISGIVVENVVSPVPVDGPGFVRLADDKGGLVTLFYSHGEMPCEGTQNRQVGASLEEGDRIIAYGQALSSSSLSVCPSRDYRIMIESKARTDGR